MQAYGTCRQYRKRPKVAAGTRLNSKPCAKAAAAEGRGNYVLGTMLESEDFLRYLARKHKLL